MKPKYRIGDYVRVMAVVDTAYSSGTSDNPAKPWESRTCYKKLRRSVLAKHVFGWIVGAARRFEGEVKGMYSEDDRPYLEHTGSKLVWRIAQSMMNAPVEAFDEDVRIQCEAVPRSCCKPYYPKSAWLSPPMRLGTAWPNNGGWTKAQQKQEMAEWPRDKNGKWLPKVTARMVPDVTN